MSLSNSFILKSNQIINSVIYYNQENNQDNEKIEDNQENEDNEDNEDIQYINKDDNYIEIDKAKEIENNLNSEEYNDNEIEQNKKNCGFNKESKAEKKEQLNNKYEYKVCDDGFNISNKNKVKRKPIQINLNLIDKFDDAIIEGKRELIDYKEDNAKDTIDSNAFFNNADIINYGKNHPFTEKNSKLNHVHKFYDVCNSNTNQRKKQILTPSSILIDSKKTTINDNDSKRNNLNNNKTIKESQSAKAILYKRNFDSQRSYVNNKQLNKYKNRNKTPTSCNLRYAYDPNNLNILNNISNINEIEKDVKNYSTKNAFNRKNLIEPYTNMFSLNSPKTLYNNINDPYSQSTKYTKQKMSFNNLRNVDFNEIKINHTIEVSKETLIKVNSNTQETNYNYMLNSEAKNLHLQSSIKNKQNNFDRISEVKEEELNSFCEECYINIPLRAKHCKICKSCIAGFDHHCYWLGVCIGEKNKIAFLFFLFLTTLEIIFASLIVSISFDILF